MMMAFLTDAEAAVNIIIVIHLTPFIIVGSSITNTTVTTLLLLEVSRVEEMSE